MKESCFKGVPAKMSAIHKLNKNCMSERALLEMIVIMKSLHGLHLPSVKTLEGVCEDDTNSYFLNSVKPKFTHDIYDRY